MKKVTSIFLMAVVLCNVVNADISHFQEGVAPDGTYSTGAVTIRSDLPDANQNGSDQVLIGRYNNNSLRGLLEFDLSTIRGAVPINSARLVMTTDAVGIDDGDNSITIQVYSYSNNVDEATATWNNPGFLDSTAGGTLGVLLGSATFNPLTSGLSIEFANNLAFRTAVSDAVTGDGILRLILKRNDESINTDDFVRFSANSSSTSGNRPELIVDYDPSPQQDFQEGVSPDVSYTAGAVTIRSDIPDANQNGSDNVLVGVYQNTKLHGLLEFDLSDIAGAVSVNYAGLIMTTDTVNPGADNGDNIIRIQVYSYTNDFDETTSTWNNPGIGDSTSGGTFGVKLTDATFDNTALGLSVEFLGSLEFRTAVSDALAGDRILRLILKRDGEPYAEDYARFVAESSGTAANRPQLIVRYTPPPRGTLIVIH